MSNYVTDAVQKILDDSTNSCYDPYTDEQVSAIISKYSVDSNIRDILFNSSLDEELKQLLISELDKQSGKYRFILKLVTIDNFKNSKYSNFINYDNYPASIDFSSDGYNEMVKIFQQYTTIKDYKCQK